MIVKIRNKITEKEAIQFMGAAYPTKSNYDECFEFIGDAVDTSRNLKGKQLRIHTLEGTMVAEHGDWIIKGLNGEFYPCKPDIFEKSYEVIA